MRAVLLGIALLAGCQQERPAPALLGVDLCQQQEYERECSEDLLTPDELRQCVDSTWKQAVRIRAGIPHGCLQ